jgi:hypothetical protein
MAQFVGGPPLTNEKMVSESVAGRIQCCHRINAERQPIRNASIYILFLQPMDVNDAGIAHQASNCVHAHADILQCNSDAKLVMLAATSPGAEVDWHKHVAHMCHWTTSSYAA